MSRPTNPSRNSAVRVLGKFRENVDSIFKVFSEDDLAHLLDTDFTIADAQMLVKLLPRLVHWFRERGHDHAAVMRDFERVERDLGRTFLDAHRQLREKYLQQAQEASFGPGVTPRAPVEAPVPVPIPVMAWDQAAVITSVTREDYARASLSTERTILGKNLTSKQHSRVLLAANTEYTRALERIEMGPIDAEFGDSTTSTIMPDNDDADLHEVVRDDPNFRFSGSTPERPNPEPSDA